ncbi:MAG TPA: phosphopentomutase [Kiritimatiellia bacterium]|nr:phosphopentomutase [Kiritimatiellia bacterium]HRZ13616.1 phosphopentomutase [Kiritimatiellia bacterium]HSA19288.1 phosphopentomutase [Kiritimatiellia bacterium]
MKIILIVLDSIGIGEMPDAAKYGDVGSATLPHLAKAAGGLKAPVMQSLGLGNIQALLPGGKPIDGVPPAGKPLASWGAMQEVSDGKDTVTGHWEIAGLVTIPGFSVFPPNYPSFPPELVEAFEKRTGRKILGNKAASGTAIIDELGPAHMKTGKWIAYTSADSVFQIAAHEEIVKIPELYKACEIARELCDKYKVGRVIARPFVGKPGAYMRTENRRDFAFKPEESTVMERLVAAGVPVYAVGKIEDIFAHRGISESNHTGNNQASQQAVTAWTKEKKKGLIFANFIDFDMTYGHRRDAKGYARSIEQTDQWLASYLPLLGKDDVLMITADHGNDPTYKGTDHTREFVPLLVYRPGALALNLGIRQGFFDIAQSIAAYFGLPPLPRGTSFLS